MPRSVVVTFSDGTSHTYDGVPDTATPKDVNARATADFKKGVTGVEAAPAPAPAKPAADVPPPEDKSVLGFGANFARDVFNTAKGAVKEGASLGAALSGSDDGSYLINKAKAAGNAVSSAIDIAKGGAQRVRDLSPVEYRGSAPRMDTAAYDNFADANYKKYGTVANALNTVYEHPLGPVLTAAQIAVPALRSVGALDAVGDATAAAAAAAKATKSGQFVSRYATAPERVMSAASKLKAQVGTEYGLGENASIVASRQHADAAAAGAARESRLQARRAQIVAARDALKTQQAEAQSLSVPNEISVGEPAHLGAMAAPLRTATLQGAEDIGNSMRAADEQLRGALREHVDAQEADGIGVSDVPEAQGMVARSKALVDPEPGTAPNVGGTLADSAGGKVHKELIAGLTPETRVLTAEQGARAKAAGIDVKPQQDGSFIQIIKPGYDKIDNLRRHMFQISKGKVDGYGALEGQQASKIYNDLNDVLNKYTDGMHGEVQANWRMGSENLAPYNRVGVGKALTKVQKGTNQFATSASKLPGAILGGGADTLEQAAAVAGQGPVSTFLRSNVQNELSALPNTSEALTKAIRPGTPLGDRLEADPALKASVNDHIAHVLNAEKQASTAAYLGQRADMYDQHIGTLDKVAKTLNDKTIPGLQDASKAAAETAREYGIKLKNLDKLPPEKVASAYNEILDSQYKRHIIDTTQYAQGRVLATQAEEAFKDLNKRNAWMREAYRALGAGGVVGAANAAGVPLLIGAGAVGLGTAGYVGRKALQRGFAHAFKGK